MSTNTCPHCGAQHRAGARFCPTTGSLIQPLGRPAQQPAYSPPQTASPEASPVGGLTGRLEPHAHLKGRYLILRKIGQGGMAAVYQVTDTQNPDPRNQWAIKEMSDAALSDPKEREYAVVAFKREAELLGRLNHPNLPKVIDAFTEGGKHYLVMEFVPGKTLETLLEQRGAAFPPTEVIPWALQLCDVLGYLHNQTPKIIFRDLKPSNIMLTPQGQIKLIDFGIVRFFKPGKQKDTMALGTPGYAPREALGGQTDERSDLYSLCVVLHQLLTGHNPATTMFDLPSIRSMNAAVSPELERIILRGLENERELRWESTQEMHGQIALVGRVSGTARPGVLSPAPQVSGTRAAERPPIGFQSTMPAAGLPTPPQPAHVPPARPTTRLLIAATRLSGTQLALIAAAVVIAIGLLTFVLAEPLNRLDFDWNNVLVMAMFGSLGYSAYPKRGMAFISQALLSSLIVVVLWFRIGDQDYEIFNLAAGALLSGALMEGWVALLPRVKAGAGENVWIREAVWLTLMAVFGTALFIGLTTEWRVTGLQPLQILFSAAFGLLGWFLGDLFNQYQTFRRAGV